MKEELAEQLIRETEKLYVKMVFDIVGAKPSEKQRAELLRLWKESSSYGRLTNACAKAPDGKEGVIRELLEKFPREVYKLLRDWTKQVSDGIGGREPAFTDKARRQIIQEVRTLQKTLKRPVAIERVAIDWQTTPTKIEGLLKHQNRYKDA